MEAKSFALQSISERFENVRRRMKEAAQRSNRAATEVKLIAISKTHPVPRLRTAIEAGMTELGENRVQEAETKISDIGRDTVRWHLVGHLQTNKARRAVELFHLIHSLIQVVDTTSGTGLC